MQVYHPVTARAFMQVVDVLGNDRDLGDMRLKGHDCTVAWVRLRLLYLHAAPLIPAPDQFRVALKGLSSGKLFGVELRPQSGKCIPESGYATFTGNACPREEHHGLG